MDRFQEIIEDLRIGFNGRLNKTYQQRILHLNALEKVIRQNEKYIIEALQQDFNKPVLETELTELLPFYIELKHLKKNLKNYMRGKDMETPLVFFPAKSKVHFEPKGVVFIMGAWNYPVNLVLIPLLSALGAGNTVLLKPSEVAPNTSAMLARLLNQTFDKRVVRVIEGGAEETQQILQHKLDHIFYTGSTKVGNIIYEAAAKQLTPVTLELGGKSPVIVDEKTNIKKAIKRILWGKLVNAGQTCVAPDYLFFPRSKKDELIKWTNYFLDQFKIENPDNFAHIINQRHFDRLTSLIQESDNFLYKGTTDEQQLWMSFFMVEVDSLDHPLMKEEIFGPILPVIFYDDMDEFYEIYEKNPDPLSLYIFSKKRGFIDYFVRNFAAGGVMVNDTVMHLGNHSLPFGGRGNSGMGNYHGWSGFKCFSHEKSVMTQKYWLESFYRYPNYSTKKLNLIRRVKKLF